MGASGLGRPGAGPPMLELATVTFASLFAGFVDARAAEDRC